MSAAALEARAGAGIAPEEIEDVLGDYATTVLWGAAFEDLVATDLPDGRNIAYDYLRRRGWKESASTRDYIAGLRRSVISLYEVSGLAPGRPMQLRDLVRGGEPVRVSEKRGSEGLQRWDRIATRVVPLRDRAVISGTLMLFEREASEALLASLSKIRTKAPREVAAAAREFGIEADAKVLAGMLTPDRLLAQAAFMFTNAWLDAALRAAQGCDRPELLNSEGDPLDSRCFTSLAAGRDGLSGCARRSPPSLRSGRGPNLLELAGRAQCEPKSGAAPAKGGTLTTTMEDGSRCSARWSSRAVACHWRRTRSLAWSAGGRCSSPCWPAWSLSPSPSGSTSSGCWLPSARRRSREPDSPRGRPAGEPGLTRPALPARHAGPVAASAR